MKKTTVVVVDDSLFYRESIKKRLELDVNISVVGKAGSAAAARDLIVEHIPDVLIVDVNLGAMSGTEFIQQLLPQYYLPVIVISSDPTHRAAALSMKVVDFIRKPETPNGRESQDFYRKLIIGVKRAVSKYESPLSFDTLSSTVLAIGASTGGTDAIETLLRTMPPVMPPILMAQHMSARFTASLAQRVNRLYALSTKEAEDGDVLIPGQIYVAPGGMNLSIQGKKGQMRLAVTPPEDSAKATPNIDVLFHSVAQVCDGQALGVLLTGMGKDGARGLKAMYETNCPTIAQDEETSVVYGMPRTAKEMGAVTYQLPLNEITAKSLSLLQQHSDSASHTFPKARKTSKERKR